MSMLISGTHAKQLVENHGAQVVDVRNPNEFGNGCAPGAINIPVHMIPQVAHLHLDNQRPIVLYCLSGGRSAQALMILNRMGFNDVHNVGTLQNYIRG